MKETMDASAMDSPNCGMIMGMAGMGVVYVGVLRLQQGINPKAEIRDPKADFKRFRRLKVSDFGFRISDFTFLFPHHVPGRGSDAASRRAMHRPQIRMKRHRCIFGVLPLRWRIQQAKAFAR